MEKFKHLSPAQAWRKIMYYKNHYYDSMAAMYSGDHEDLRRTAEHKTFWNRSGTNCKIHVPIAAEIASTSADLLFAQRPKITVFHGSSENNESEQQNRMEYILNENNIESKLMEGAETAAALGDVYLKIRWNKKDSDVPILDIAQPDSAWPEYYLGKNVCIHFFTPLVIDEEKESLIRIYECYLPGEIHMKLFKGNADGLGTEMSEKEMREFGFEEVVTAPVNDMLAVHIANMRPNRTFRESMLGRSDFDGIRDLCDALDETYSSWIRDIRLAKAKLIVPVEYMERKPDVMVQGVKSTGRWEFDPDVETYVAMDIDTDRGGASAITPSQFAIRADEHAKTCTQLIEDILMSAGYSPQSFGLDINGTAQSGTALNIRERKSITTRNKKQTYWRIPLQHIMTAMIHLDAALYSEAGSHPEDRVAVSFVDSIGTDMSSIANTIEMLNRAQAISLRMKVSMQHPDWSESQQMEEVARIRDDYALGLDSQLPDAELGDFESGVGNGQEKSGNELNDSKASGSSENG